MSSPSSVFSSSRIVSSLSVLRVLLFTLSVKLSSSTLLISSLTISWSLGGTFSGSFDGDCSPLSGFNAFKSTAARSFGLMSLNSSSSSSELDGG
ncbi:hypothetical protein GDO81_023445 [Engystomops pustulosus]|uniref:Secreted protein n=1 Tax=Engystomops pustulosus TaxID=76066 RepID=A0AAV6YM47_ENGPU|nr:hypothetical protein GDO81_023445 [Engystomops pustulosus]